VAQLDDTRNWKADIIADWFWDADMRLRKTLITIDTQTTGFQCGESGKFRNRLSVV
jgi:hypothetical protein